MREILPAILVKTRKKAQARLRRVAKVAKKVQIDVLDGKFAPNKTLFPKNFKGIKSKLKYEWQLMVKNPEDFVHDIVTIPQSKLLIFHIEATKTPERTLSIIEHCKLHNLKVGIALNPRTPARKVKPYLKMIDHVLVMTVKPGFMGQKFIDMSKKIRQIRKWNRKIDIEVDGGIHRGTAKLCRKAGANLFVVGSALVDAKDIRKEYDALKKEVK